MSFLFVVGSAVKITSFVVPSSYVIEDEENPGQLVLDCAYESEPNEKGIVVKWWLNDSAIYQWIPKEPAPPRTFVSIQLHYSKRFNFNMNDTQKKHMHKEQQQSHQVYLRRLRSTICCYAHENYTFQDRILDFILKYTVSSVDAFSNVNCAVKQKTWILVYVSLILLAHFSYICPNIFSFRVFIFSLLFFFSCFCFIQCSEYADEPNPTFHWY